MENDKQEDIQYVQDNVEDRVNSLAQTLESRKENADDETIDLIDETKEVISYLEKSYSVRNDLGDEIYEECQKLFDTFDEIIAYFIEFGEYLVNVCDSFGNDSIQKKKGEFIERYKTCNAQYEKIASSIYDFTNEISKFHLDFDANVDEMSSELIEEKTQEYDEVKNHIEKINNVFEKYIDIVVECNEAIKKIDKEISEIMLTEEVKGEYWCVYQPGAAIFGVGKTEQEAWKDAEEWADDVSDKNWKQSFDIKPCTEELYNYVNQHGTPDTWGETNGILTTTEEEEQLNEAISNL